MTSVTFTFDWYREFLQTLADHGYQDQTYDTTLDDGDLLLRHDVDWSPRNALTLARIEADHDITATYFFLLTSPAYNLFHKPVRHTLEAIEALGHDIGLHFSTHQHFDTQPPDTDFESAVSTERSSIAPIVTELSPAVSFHRPPDWVFHRSYDGFISTYEDRFFTDIGYRGDSNQRWRDEPPLQDDLPSKLQVLVHPGLWGKTDASFETRFHQYIDQRLERTATFLEDQFIDKRYNIDEYCDHLPTAD